MQTVVLKTIFKVTMLTQKKNYKTCFSEDNVLTEERTGYVEVVLQQQCQQQKKKHKDVINMVE